LLKPNQQYEFTIDMVGTANTFLPGHRIRIDITSSNFPQFDRNPNTGEPLGSATKTRVALQTVFHGSHVILPVVTNP
jgi:putative CocE/NonD family hydrolase